MTTPRESAPLRYRLTHQESLLGVAYFSPAPAESLTLEECLEHIRRTPNDEFMRAHVRPLLAALDVHSLGALHADADPVVQSLVLETALLTPAHSELWARLRVQAQVAAELTPQIFLRSVSLSDHDLHARASLLLAANIFEHQPLPSDMDALPLTAAPDSDAADPAMLKSAPPPCLHVPDPRPGRHTRWPWSGSTDWASSTGRRCATTPPCPPGGCCAAGNWTARQTAAASTTAWTDS